MFGALRRGLSLSDFEIMTVGMILDYVITDNNLRADDAEDRIREATQDDMSAF